jgi:DNA-binding Lrp family transcriptional regulator
MKNINSKLIPLLKKGNCTPLITSLARKLKEPSTTLHYNIKKLEKEKAIKSYKAVFDYSKIDEGYCMFILVNLTPDEYGDPERIGKELKNIEQIESIDIITGDWEMLLKVRTKDQNDYYDFVKSVMSRKGIARLKSLTSLKQIKTEFVVM